MSSLITSFSHLANWFKSPVQMQSSSPLVYLQHPLTTGQILIFSILLASIQIFGSPINCQTEGNPYDLHFIQEYCFTSSTFSMWTSTGAVYPGVGGGQGGEVVYHHWYQHLPLFFMVLSVLLKLPYLLWIWWEGGLMGMLVPTNSGVPSINILNWEEVKVYTTSLSKYFKRNIRSRAHRYYGYVNMFIELLCFVNLVIIIISLDIFLKNFLLYLPHILIHYVISPYSISPEEKMFPNFAKCSIKLFGPSGSNEVQDALVSELLYFL